MHSQCLFNAKIELFILKIAIPFEKLHERHILKDNTKASVVINVLYIY